ncbi:MAG: thymidine phosphorylase [Clostridiales bacterium]|nr:thymidine phosphorylase [Clostridiales bacterium]
MEILSLIEAKKQGKALTREQIRYFAKGAADNSIPDYQLAALLMAIRLKGMDARETADLTMEMAASGHMLSPDVGGVPVDKHSTGGVGDTTTLILAPLVAACGGKVLKMSGRGLGHTGGTVDKMESIAGMKVELPEDEFVDIVRRTGCAVVGQSAHLAPADKTLYALRDVTGTVDSIPLIASSILSKKFAAGAHAIVLDVKCGTGALMPTLDSAIELAKTMADIGAHAGRRIIAVVSGMDEPLGSHVGNALEVKEAIDVLAGRTSGPLKDVALYLGSQMLVAAGVQPDEKAALTALEEALNSGRGLEKLKEMIIAQGGDGRVCDDTGLLPAAPVIRKVSAPCDGYLEKVDGVALGLAAQQMGAGRIRKGDAIDPAVGFVMEIRMGDHVQAGDPICTLHARTEESALQAEARILNALTFSPAPTAPARLLHALVTAQGVEHL